jgi:hypothetical protein
MKLLLKGLVVCAAGLPLAYAQNYVFTPIQGPFQSLISNEAVWADINNDGRPDLLTSGNSRLRGRRETHVYLNRGADRFEEIDSGLPTGGPLNIAVADVNGDGKMDVAMSGLGGGNPNNIYFGNGSGAFVTGPPLTSGGGFQSLHFGDYDNDGDPDLITGASAQILRNDGAGLFNLIDQLFLPLETGSSNFYDANFDGRLDVVQTGFFGPGTFEGGRVWLQESPTSFIMKDDELATMRESSEIQIRDANCDNKADLFFNTITYRLTNEAIGYVYTNKSPNSFLRNRLIAIGTSFNSGLIDIEGDGIPEIIVVGRPFASLVPLPIATEILKREANGDYQIIPSLNLPRFRTASIATIDYDGDRDEDLFIIGDLSPSGGGDDYSEAAFLFRNDTAQSTQRCRPQVANTQMVPGLGLFGMVFLSLGFALLGMRFSAYRP